MKNRDYPLAPTYFGGGDEPGKKPKKKTASSTPAHEKKVKSLPTPSQLKTIERAGVAASALHQAKSQTSDPSILSKYIKANQLSQDSVRDIRQSQVSIVKVPAKKVGK